MELTDKISKAILLLFLAGASYQDQKKETVSVLYIAIGVLSGILLNVLGFGKGWANMAAGALVGLLTLLIGYASRQAIGYGDGLVMIASGTFLGLADNLLLLMIALVICALCAVVLISFRIKKKNERIPFIPFIFTGSILMLMVNV